MTTEQLNNDAKRLYGVAKSKGFYDAYPEPADRLKDGFVNQKLMLIVTEVAEAYESFRANKIDASKEESDNLFDNHQKLIEEGKYSETYNKTVKGTVAEELADIYIRTCDLAGATETELFADENQIDVDSSRIDDIFRRLTHTCVSWQISMSMRLSDIISYTERIAKYFNVDLEKHIELKNFRNKEREYMHGKIF